MTYSAIVNTGLMDKKFRIIKNLGDISINKDKCIYVTLQESQNQNPEVEKKKKDIQDVHMTLLLL